MKLGFIGTGNMASAIMGGVINKGLFKADEIIGADVFAPVVFEDILPGIQAGLNAGMKVCAVEDAYSTCDREKKQALADYYIEDYRGLFAPCLERMTV